MTLTPEEMDAIVAQLPECSKLGHPMRAYYEVMRETVLRPSTLHRLKTADDYQPGAPYLTIREDADKARYGCELPRSDRARAALDSACPEQGEIFPKFDGRHTLRKAALAAGLDPERAAESVLPGHRLGHQRVGRPNEESSRVAQLPGIKECGREDSRALGIRQGGMDAVHGAARFLCAIRRPLKGAEYTVGSMSS